MKAYVITLIGITISIISLILFLTLGQIYFMPLLFILPLSSTCLMKSNQKERSSLNVELDNSDRQDSKDYYYIFRCSNCGKIIHEESPKYCPHCGIELSI